MKLKPAPIALALSAALGTLAALPAQAAPLTVTSSMLSGSRSIVDNEGGSDNSSSGDLSLSGSLSQFNPNLGVLTGTSLNISGTRTTTVTAVGNGTSSSSKTSSGTGTSALSLAAPGVTTYNSGSANLGANCTGTKAVGCTNTVNSAITAQSLAVAAGNLNAYVGAGTVSGVSATATTLSANHTTAAFPGAETTTHAISASVQAEYQYLLHADASFDGGSQLSLTLDFGTVTQNSAVSSQGFSIFNAAGNRVGLDLDLISGSGDTSVLTTDLAAFLNLGAGQDSGFLAFLDTSGLGTFSATYSLSFSDQDTGASDSRFSYRNYLSLTLTGNVIEQQDGSVPLPGALALMGIGLVGLAASRRRRSGS